MLLFNSEMHLVTFVFVVIDLMVLTFQVFYYYSRPQDKRRLWFLLLLFLLLFYNVTSGLFPDVRLGMPVVFQNILAYGAGFLMSCYFPWYFYKVFNLPGLRFHAVYGVWCFLMLPYVVFICIMYPLTGELHFALKLGMVLPFFYSLVLLWAILSCIRKKILMKMASSRPYSSLEMYAITFAVMPWVCLSVLSVLGAPQWVEALVTNVGFIGVFVLYMARSAALNRIEHNRLMSLDQAEGMSFEQGCKNYMLTAREMEIAALICRGMTYHDIAEKLFISGKTVDRHVQNIFLKSGARNKMELLGLLGFGFKDGSFRVSGALKGLNNVPYGSDI